MKKIFFGLIIGLVIGASSSVFADGIIGKKIQNTYDVIVNGKKLDEKAIVVDGTSYLPVRKIGEVTGFSVKFDSKVGVTLTGNGGNAALDNEKVSNSSNSNKYQNMSIEELDKIYFDLVGEYAELRSDISLTQANLDYEKERIKNYLENIVPLLTIDPQKVSEEEKAKSDKIIKEYEETLEKARKRFNELEKELKEIEKAIKNYIKAN